MREHPGMVEVDGRTADLADAGVLARSPSRGQRGLPLFERLVGRHSPDEPVHGAGNLRQHLGPLL